jgi:hypothetical protein
MATTTSSGAPKPGNGWRRRNERSEGDGHERRGEDLAPEPGVLEEEPVDGNGAC